EGALLHTPYGATEALPVASIAHPEILGETAARTAAGEGVCVGRPVEGVEVRVIRVEDGEIPRFTPDLEVPAGTTGEFVVRGPQVTRGYFGRPEADLLTKIGDPAGGFWHRMGDLGYRDASGRLWFCGRRSQRVRTEGGDLCADQCEGVFNAHPMVRRSAVVGVGEAGRQRPVAVIERARGGPHLREGEPEGPRDPVDDGRLAEEVLALGSSAPCTRGIRDVLLYRGILPVDTRHNAKIRREVLAAWAAKRLGRA
ncbi:MAG: AMP-binding protein, partial [Planctomycetaceae bacterium]|nr:AMP-binding protein [Planctomycetaceae bacterium]